MAEEVEILHKSPLLDPVWYRQTYPDLRDTPIDAARHYLEYGAREGRNPHPLFDSNFYLKQNPDVAASGMNPLLHYILSGAKQRRDPNPHFDTEYYLSQILIPQGAELNPLAHYLRAGKSAGLRPFRAIDPNPRARQSSQALSADIDQAPCDLVRREDDEYVGDAEIVDVRDWHLNVVLSDSSEVSLDKPIGIFIHLFHDGLAHEISSYLARIKLPMSIYITTDTDQKRKCIAETFLQRGIEPEITIVPNCGFDIAPFIFELSKRISEHDICLKLHGKKSGHNRYEFGKNWREQLFGQLMPDSSRVCSIVNAFNSIPELGILMPQHWNGLAGWLNIGANYEPMEKVLGKLNVRLTPDQEIEFPGGSMFWFRSEALLPLIQINFQLSDFSEPLDQRDATLAHGIERCFLFFCARAGRKWAFLPDIQPQLARSNEETKRLIRESGLFDGKFYLRTNPDVASANIDPIQHWVTHGAREGRDPSASFNTNYYSRLAEISHRPNINPLVHYVTEGRKRGLLAMRPSRVPATVVIDDIYATYVRAEKGQNYVAETLPILRHSDIRLIAFYLPQFHPFAENDKFWGRGFTEWTNTTKAIPMFKGHYQPRLPGELGFYDTRIKQVLTRQIELAKQYGIYGFCLHHYFFDGKPIMRAPYNALLANPDLDIPFFLHWANEPWTMRWDGLSNRSGVLLEQNHSLDDDLAFFRDIEPALHDRRYIKINGRPVLAIYRPTLFPDVTATIERWRQKFHRAGLKDPYMVVVQSTFEGTVDPRKYGFDAAIEFPPNNLELKTVNHRMEFYDPAFEGDVFDYEHAVDEALATPMPEYQLFRGIMPDWDCTPRRSNPALMVNSAPHRYQRWLEGLCAVTKTDPNRSEDEKLIFVNAWNEWAEGAYLEPDRKYGYAYLDATARALNNFRPASIDQLGIRVLVAAHIYYLDLLDEFIEHFLLIPGKFDLMITTAAEKRDYVLQYILERKSPSIANITVTGVENVGADIGPFILHTLRESQRYDICCKVHSKKTPYNSQFFGWREYLLRNLLGAPQNIAAIVEAFSNNSKLGLVYPKAFPPVADHVEWGSNFELTASLLQKLGIRVTREEQPVFPTGSMFWFRPSALASVLKLGLTPNDFVRAGDGPRDAETGAIVDGTMAHALERMFLYAAKAAGYHFKEVLF